MFKSKIASALIIAATVLLPTAPSFAGRAEADACATKLSPDGKAIYAETIGSAATAKDMQDLVRTKTRALVMSGKLGRNEARPAAEAAGACLKLAK
jgi:hypothetical protein